MTIRRFLSPICILTALTTSYSGGQMMPDAPVKNFILHRFDKETGYRAWKLEGKQARYNSADDILVEKMKLTAYVNEGKKDTTIQSSLAAMHPESYQASGDADISVTGEGFSVTGKGWFWDYRENRIRIHKQVRVSFKSDLNTLLK